ncbi:MAG: AAA family ATPase [Caldilineaceae bacterium]|nr:AAA family ATPase [Caldilineaceae bacterium]
MKITQFTMEEVRCFAERQEFEIRPLTFLVGENSTGKTTMLACFHILAEFLSGGEVDFNLRPYSMGIFRDIIRRSKKQDKSFALGIRLTDKDDEVDITFGFAEKSGGVEPVVQSMSIKFSDGEIVLIARDRTGGRFEPKAIDEGKNQFHIEVDSSRLNGGDPFFPLIYFANNSMDGKSDHNSAFSRFIRGKIEKGISFLNPGNEPIATVFSTSPVRSQPKRTYDPTREFQDPEGSDVPMMLTRIASTKPEEWERLRQQLINFGKSSGLFQSIDTEALGSSLGSPFQLKFKVKGPKTNIVDVGYGVSQILPILVYILTSSINESRRLNQGAGKYFLLQQPEVHLHPKAQAELSSLLAQLASTGNHSFMVETHSDNMIDRVRIEIMKGNIKSDDVSLIYLEPRRNIVKVHNISIDEMGNLLDVPTNYRKFFFYESSRLMGFEGT